MMRLTFDSSSVPILGGRVIRITRISDESGEPTTIILETCTDGAPQWPLSPHNIQIPPECLPELVRALSAILDGL